MRTPVYRQFSYIGRRGSVVGGSMGQLCKVLTKWQQQLTVNNGKRAKRNKITKDIRGRGTCQPQHIAVNIVGGARHKERAQKINKKNLPVSSAKGARQPRSGVNGKWQTANSGKGLLPKRPTVPAVEFSGRLRHNLGCCCCFHVVVVLIVGNWALLQLLAVAFEQTRFTKPFGICSAIYTLWHMKICVKGILTLRKYM